MASNDRGDDLPSFLCAHVLGLGACWLGVHPREQRVKSLQEILGLPEKLIPDPTDDTSGNIGAAIR